MSEPLELRLIVAVDRAWGIGRNNELLFRLSADLRRFKALTMGHVLLMGRHTFDSLPGPLPGREHVVLSRDPAFAPAGVTVCPSAEQALTRARELAGARGAQIFVIGGARVYAALLNTCGSALVTKIDALAEGADAFFPDLDARPGWRCAVRSGWLEEKGIRFRYCRYERCGAG